MSRRAFFSIFAIGAILRIVWINVPPLWYDENFTLIVARLPFGAMIRAVIGDVHPPLWYVIEWAIYHTFPNAPAWVIRVPALLFSLATLPMYMIVMSLLRIKPRVRVIAFALLAVLPFQIWYAQEGRMYAMLEFFVLVALAGALADNYILLFVGSLALLYTQNYGPLYLAAIALVIFVRKDWMIFFIRQSLIEFNKAMAVIVSACVLWIPWLMIVRQQMSNISGRYWIVDKSIGAVVVNVYKLFFAATVPTPLFTYSYIVTLVALIAGCFAILKKSEPPVPGRATVVIMAFVPLALAYLISLVWQPVILFRPLIGITPFLYLAICWNADEMKAGSKYFTIAIIAPILIAGVYGYYKNVAAMKGEGAISSLPDALAYVEDHWRDGDIIYAADDGPWINLEPYTDKPIYRMPGCAEKGSFAPVLGSLSDTTRAAIGMQIAELSDIPHRRAWVFAPFTPLHPDCYREQVKPLTSSEPVYVVDDSTWIFSGVWMVTR